MATKLWRGNTGSSVLDLQQKLNRNGYNLDEDGVFGSNTYNAVLDYQRKNNLAVDGVVGDETWGSLNKTTAPSRPTTGKDVLTGVSDETYDKLHQLEEGFKPSEAVEAAREVQKSLEAVRPGAYQSSFDEELARLYEQISEDKGFSYDPRQDAQYRNYAHLYAQRGREAMEDTMGQAAGLTGGFSSSYAQSASQQAYGRYMQELAELMPQLEQSARQQYEAGQQKLLDQYDWLSQQEQADYKRYLQEQEAWQKDYDRAGKEAETLRQAEYDDYKLRLQHYTSMANAEQKASGGARANTGAASSAATKSSLSSTAAQSLQRAMSNYFKAGKTDQAAALAQQYKDRMTPAQKQMVMKLFAANGAQIAL